MTSPNPDLSALLSALSDHAGSLQIMEKLLQDLRRNMHREARQQRATQLAQLLGADPRHTDPLSLTRHFAQVYSQNGEDGMVAEIFRRIGTGDRLFLEIGIGDGRQCNTRLLLESGWRGVWMEGNAPKAAEARATFQDFIANGQLKVIEGLVDPANIDAILDEAGVPASLDFLSLDIDQHTHSLWRVLRCRARVVCIEYNASLPPSLALEVPFDPAKSWDGSNWFGAGLKTLELIGAARDMSLVGCDVNGVNAFFVAAAEAAGQFRAPFTAEAHYQPPFYHGYGHTGHRPSPQARRWVTAPEAEPGR